MGRLSMTFFEEEDEDDNFKKLPFTLNISWILPYTYQKAAMSLSTHFKKKDRAIQINKAQINYIQKV
jgi:hypothetical protein